MNEICRALQTALTPVIELQKALVLTIRCILLEALWKRNGYITIISVKTNTMKDRNKLGSGMALGMAIGCAIGVALDNIGVWLAIGLALGAGIGNRWSQQEEQDEKEGDA